MSSTPIPLNKVSNGVHKNKRLEVIVLLLVFVFFYKSKLYKNIQPQRLRHLSLNDQPIIEKIVETKKSQKTF